MSGKKRFVQDSFLIVDSQKGRVYIIEFEEEAKELVDLLNEQQSTIQSLKEENGQLKKGKARLTERLRECSMRLDRFNCR